MLKSIDTLKPIYRNLAKIALLASLMLLPIACGADSTDGTNVSPNPPTSATRSIEKTCVLSNSGDTVLGILSANGRGPNTLVDIDQGNDGTPDIQNLAGVLAPGLQYNETPSRKIQDKVCFW